MLAKLRDGLHAIRGLAHHLQAVHHIQQRHQPLANHVVIFDNQHANRILLSLLAPSNLFAPALKPHRSSLSRLARHFQRSADGRRAFLMPVSPKCPGVTLRPSPLQCASNAPIVPHFQRNLASGRIPTAQKVFGARRASSHYGWLPAPRAEFRAPSPAAAGDKRQNIEARLKSVASAPQPCAATAPAASSRPHPASAAPRSTAARQPAPRAHSRASGPGAFAPRPFFRRSSSASTSSCTEMPTYPCASVS
jgi:hypothetical protein